MIQCGNVTEIFLDQGMAGVLSEESGVGTSRVQQQVKNEITPTLAPYRDTDEDDGGIFNFFLNVILLVLVLFYCMHVLLFIQFYSCCFIACMCLCFLGEK